MSMVKLQRNKGNTSSKLLMPLSGREQTIKVKEGRYYENIQNNYRQNYSKG